MTSDAEPLAPVLSVVMPVHNTRPPWLLEAVESVAERANVSYELILVDDGSTDEETVKALDRLEQDGIHVLRFENAGPSAARNRGIAAATAPYVLPLDSDDRLGRDFCQSAIEVLEADSDVSIVAGATELFGGRSTYLKAAPLLTLADFLLGNRASVTSVFRRNDWLALGGFDEGLRGAYEDHEWWIRVLSLGGKCVGLPLVAVEYRFGHDSASTKATGDARTRTRSSVIRNNKSRHDVMLEAAFEAMDKVNPTREEVDERRRDRDLVSRYGALDMLLGKVPGARRMAVEINRLAARVASRRSKS